MHFASLFSLAGAVLLEEFVDEDALLLLLVGGSLEELAEALPTVLHP